MQEDSAARRDRLQGYLKGLGVGEDDLMQQEIVAVDICLDLVMLLLDDCCDSVRSEVPFNAALHHLPIVRKVHEDLVLATATDDRSHPAILHRREALDDLYFPVFDEHPLGCHLELFLVELGVQ